MILAMVDVDQFKINDFIPCDGKSVDGIRIVFYKHQVNEAIKYAKVINDLGYKLFMQPMVTIDYSMAEYSLLCDELIKLNPIGISIVDSFGYMTPADFRRYFKILDNLAPDDVIIGFHSHQNMNLALPVAVDVLEYQTNRKLVVDCSLLGMGRGAGNLQTELVANYYNNSFVPKYNVSELLRLVNDYIMPIKEQRDWGYSPYYFLTAYNRCHPNYAAYLLDNYQISLTDFADYLETVPSEMKTKCRRPYVDELYHNYIRAKERNL
jgi:4-hydroxy 2-oxovalerate aldolase